MKIQGLGGISKMSNAEAIGRAIENTISSRTRLTQKPDIKTSGFFNKNLSIGRAIEEAVSGPRVTGANKPAISPTEAQTKKNIDYFNKYFNPLWQR